MKGAFANQENEFTKGINLQPLFQYFITYTFDYVYTT